MRIERIDRTSSLHPQLREFVAKHGLILNSGAWLDSYQTEKIVRCAILNNNNDINGCFVYYVFKKYGFRFVISPPYTPDIALFYLNPAQSVVGRNSYEKDLMTAMSEYFGSLNADYLSLNLPLGVTDTQPFTWAGFVSRSRFTYLIDLSLSTGQLWDNLSPEKRKSLNKAGKDELRVEETNDADLLYGLIEKSLGRNKKLSNTSVIRNILETFTGQGRSIAFVAWHNNVPIGATFCLVNGNKAMYLFGGFSSENKHHGAGVSCMWQSILKARELQLSFFDFEGSMNARIERYFREFGGELKPYHCIEKVRPLLKVLLRFKKHNAF